jgi:hypothetical protein
MHLVRAVEILGRLRDGEDPHTGRALPKESPCQTPEVVRALYTVLAALPDAGFDDTGEPAGAVEPRAPSPSRRGQAWSDDEDERLAAAFDAGESAAKLARSFGRSSKAIRLRLVKLGRISPEDAPAPRTRPTADPVTSG